MNISRLTFDDLPDEQPQSARIPRDVPKKSGIAALSFDDIPDEPLTPMQGAGAVATGFNRSALAGIPGMPVKTALDVVDLVRMGYGYAGNKLGMLTPDEMPQPLERSRYAGSPEWIAERIASNEYGKAAIENPRPDNQTARILNAGGAGMGAAMTGDPRGLAMQFASGVSGQGASESGADPLWSMVASMGPQVAATGGPSAVRGALRGGEEARQVMLQRMEDFRRAGVDPTVGLATGNRRTQAIESALSKTPGSAGVMAKRATDIQAQMANAAGNVRDQVSPIYGPAAAGDAIKRGITDYRDRQQAIYGQMLDQAEGMIPPGMQFPANGMLTRGAATLADIEGAPNVSRVLNEPLGFTQKVVGALSQDANGQPAQQVPSRILQENGQPFLTETPGTAGGIPFDALKGLKSRVGQLAYSGSPLTADANTGAMKYLHGGAKSDLLNAAQLADAERMAGGQQPGVARQLTRADKFYQQTQDVLTKTLEPIYKAGDPASEKSYNRVASDLQSSGRNASSVMASLPLEARKQTAATVIDQLGKAGPGQQNAEGTTFSPQTFLTNWNRIKPDAKSALFLGLPGSGDVRGKLDALAKSAERLGSASKVYANPSGTAGAAALIGASTGAGGGLALIASGHPVAGATALGGVLATMGASSAAAWGMTNPRFVNWLSLTSSMKPHQMKPHLTRLNVMAQNERDPEVRDNLKTLADDIAAQWQ